MDAIPENPYFYFSPETLQMVRKDINMDKPGEMKESVRILDEWVKQEPCFIEKCIPLHYLEMTIVTSKGSIERAKRLIKNICTARTVRPDLFEPRDLREYYEIFKNNYIVTTMPKLTSKYHRLLIFKISGKVTNTILDAVYKYTFSCLDYLKVNDYHSGVVVIFDMTQVDMQHFITHVNFFEMANSTFTCLNTYGLRLHKVHVITTSKAIQTVLSIFKTFLTKKIMDRVEVNETADELLKYYSKDVLPKDFGGCDKSLQELQEELLTKCTTTDHIEHLKTMNRAKVDKSLCSVNHMSNEDGAHGTFRSLNID